MPLSTTGATVGSLVGGPIGGAVGFGIGTIADMFIGNAKDKAQEGYEDWYQGVVSEYSGQSAEVQKEIRETQRAQIYNNLRVGAGDRVRQAAIATSKINSSAVFMGGKSSGMVRTAGTSSSDLAADLRSFALSRRVTDNIFNNQQALADIETAMMAELAGGMQDDGGGDGSNGGSAIDGLVDGNTDTSLFPETTQEGTKDAIKEYTDAGVPDYLAEDLAVFSGEEPLYDQFFEGDDYTVTPEESTDLFGDTGNSGDAFNPDGSPKKEGDNRYNTQDSDVFGSEEGEALPDDYSEFNVVDGVDMTNIGSASFVNDSLTALKGGITVPTFTKEELTQVSNSIVPGSKPTITPDTPANNTGLPSRNNGKGGSTSTANSGGQDFSDKTDATPDKVQETKDKFKGSVYDPRTGTYT